MMRIRVVAAAMMPACIKQRGVPGIRKNAATTGTVIPSRAEKSKKSDNR